MVFNIPWAGGRTEDISFESTVDGINYTKIIPRATYSYDTTTKQFTINSATAGFTSGTFATKIRMTWYAASIGNVQCANFQANGR